MENDWGILRSATRNFTEASLQTANLFALLPQFKDILNDDSTFNNCVWEFIEDLLAFRFLVSKEHPERGPQPEILPDELRRIHNTRMGGDLPWVISETTRQLVKDAPDLIIKSGRMLEKIPCDPEQVWLFGSLYEYRMGLLLHSLKQGGRLQNKVIHNPQKKRQAIYYTPRDVVDFILEHSLSPFLTKIENMVKKGAKENAISDFYELSLLDPSCGGGAFLLPAWQKLIKFFDEHFQNEQKRQPEHPILVGIDIDPPAVRVARFSLWCTTPRNHPLLDANAVIEGNALWPGESDRILKFSFPEQFPHLFSSGKNNGFKCVVGNPPYAEIPNSWPASDLSQRFLSTSSKDLYTLFLEQMVHLSDPRAGRGGMIVPLSLTFSKEMSSIRHFIQNSGRHWKISSYHIRPSGIFPGVSQRTSIALVEPLPDNKTRVETTCVQRWSAEKRADLFTHLQYADVTDCIEIIAKQGRPLGIPNIGNPQLSNLLLKLLLRGEKLGDALTRTPRSPDKAKVLYYFTMAYHWLTVSAQLPDLRMVNKSVALSSLIPMYFGNEADRWVALALLASSLGFWWWQIFGDLFHVTRGVLSEFPVNPITVDPMTKERIISLAKNLQAEINESVTFFTKKGVTNANFDLTRCFGKIRPIDDTLRNYLNVPTEEWEALYANYTETTGKKIK